MIKILKNSLGLSCLTFSQLSCTEGGRRGLRSEYDDPTNPSNGVQLHRHSCGMDSVWKERIRNNVPKTADLEEKQH